MTAPRRHILYWTLFDFANTAFYVIILTVGYPLYFTEIIAGGQAHGEAYWGSAFSISMLCAALLSPVLGAAADHGGGKKVFLWVFTSLCIASTAALYLTGPGTLFWGMLLLILANIGFEAGLVFYDAFLPELATPREYGKISGYGFAMGYVGSLATLLIAFPLYAAGFAEDNLANVRLSFLIAAAMFLLFSLPMFIGVPEQARFERRGLNVVRVGFNRVLSTFREFSRYRNIARFLLSYFLYIDAVNTIIVFSSIFARETLSMSMTEIIIFFALVQTSAVGGSVLFGRIADRIGHKRSLSLTLLLWLCIVAAAYVVVDKMIFYGIGILAGVAMGSSQANSRSLMSSLTPAEKKTEFFGFFSFFGKASAVLGPFIFGVVASWINQRAAVLAVGVLLLSGFLLLQRVRVEQAEASAS